MFASNGDATPRCGVPLIGFVPRFIRRFPVSFGLHDGTFSHRLIRNAASKKTTASRCGCVGDTIALPFPSALPRATWRPVRNRASMNN